MKQFDWKRLWKILKYGENSWLDFLRFVVWFIFAIVVGVFIGSLIINGCWWFITMVVGFVIGKAIYESIKYVIKEYKNEN